MFVSLCIKKIQALTQDEILSLIPADVLAEIKAKDPHPFFQAYSIAHEGTSSPKVLDAETKPIHWTRKAIQSIKKIITKGVKFFLGHNTDNSTDNRRVLGEVVADTQKEINGKLHHVVISYHPPEVREEVKKYDIVSQEAEWNLFEEVKRFVADTIDKLTGIAMGSSSTETPAFSGARRLGMIQALDKIDDETSNGGKTMTKEELLNSITFSDIKKLIVDRNIFPTQVFSIEQLKADREINVFNELEESKAALEEKDKLLKEAEEKTNNLIQQNLKSNAEGRFKEMLKDESLKLTPAQRKYFETFKADDFEDLSDEGLNKFIQRELDRYKRFSSTSGDKTEVTITDSNHKPVSAANDYTKKENNPLLDEDYEV